MKWVVGAGMLMLLGCGRSQASFGDSFDNPGVVQAPPDPLAGARVERPAPPPPLETPPIVTVPIICGALNATCPVGSYCDYPPSAHCGEYNGTGTCTTPAQGCTMQMVLVCGCDGVTYRNQCQASAASMALRFINRCSAVDVDVDAGIM